MSGGGGPPAGVGGGGGGLPRAEVLEGGQVGDGRGAGHCAEL